VIHRGINPENILFGSLSGVCIGSFGDAVLESEAVAFNNEEEINFDLDLAE